MKNKKIIIYVLLIVIGIAGLIYGYILFKDSDTTRPSEPSEPTEPEKPTNGNENYNSLLIKTVNKNTEKGNYLISPYSIEIALNLLKESTNNTTKDEIVKVLPNREIKLFNSNQVIASNATFIKNKYKDLVLPTFTNNLKNKYKADVIYDDFNSPKVINDWVNDKTKGMINKLIDQIDPRFMFGVVNAVALDLEYQIQFDCSRTLKERFTKEDGLHMDVYMMHQTYEDNNDATYIKKDDYEAISIPYKKDSNNNEFELVAIKTDDIDKFINSLDDNKLNNLMKDGIKSGGGNIINLSLPKFSYKFELLTDKFSTILKEMGIKELFGTSPDFTNFISKENIEKNGIIPELGEAIHKTFIDLNEKGTKAAAVTAFLVNDKSAMNLNEKRYEIKFDKPFIYLIRETKTGELLFFGTVFEPTKWDGNTCQMTY